MAYVEAAETSARTALEQVDTNMNQALSLLDNMDSEIGTQIQRMKELVNGIFNEINSLAERQKEILSTDLAEYEKNKEGNPENMQPLLRVIKAVLPISEQINAELLQLHVTFNEELNNVQRAINEHVDRARDQVQEARRQVEQKRSEIESLQT